MTYPPFWLLALAIGLFLFGLSRSSVSLIDRMPVWTCALIICAALVVLCFVGAAEFSQIVIQF